MHMVKGKRVKAVRLVQIDRHMQALLDPVTSLWILHVSPCVSGRAICTTGTGSW